MADPIKKLDRLRPFKRINNDTAIPTAAPDGKGVACGCHTPGEFPNLDAEFRKFMLDRKDALGAFTRILETAREAAKTAAGIAQIATDVAKIASGIAAALGLAAGPGAPVAVVIGTLTAAAAVISTVVDFVNNLLTAVDTAIRELLARIGARLAQRAIRRIPQWVPVKDAGNKQKITVDQVQEVEGIVRRSYCDPVGTPFYQWQQWLSWSIQVEPEPAYKTLLVPGFKFAVDKGSVDDKKKSADASEQPIVDTTTVELQWDMGALRVGGEEPGVYGRTMKEGKQTEAELTDREAPFFQSDKSALEPENHWLWPTAGMYVWASGRWVYDCSRPDSLTDSKPSMYTMLNPLRAMATASWEGFGFKENTIPGSTASRNAVPAIRFMFIASRHGGHLSYPSLAEKDYEFILDLPPPPDTPSPFPIGHTNAHKRAKDELPDFPHNTIVLRPKLLRDLAKPQATFPAEVKLITPIIELIPSPGEPGVVRQVKVTVKAADLEGTGAKHAGFLLSLGWFDPNAERAATVRNCTVEYSAVRGRLAKDRDDAIGTLRDLFADEILAVKKTVEKQIDGIKIPLIPGRPISIIDMIEGNGVPELFKPAVREIGLKLQAMAHKIVDTFFDTVLDLIGKAINAGTSEEWMMHFAVNGRWRSRYLDLEEKKQQSFSSPITVDVLLGPDDLLFRSTGGVQWNPVGNILFEAKNDRLLRSQSAGGSRPEAVNWSQIATASGDDLRNLMFEYALGILVEPSNLALILGVENDPLGIRQPAGLDSPGEFNPVLPKSKPLGDLPIESAPVRFVRTTGVQVILAAEDASKDDYELFGKIRIAEQFPK